jgi:hypothetical protein
VLADHIVPNLTSKTQQDLDIDGVTDNEDSSENSEGYSDSSDDSTVEVLQSKDVEANNTRSGAPNRKVKKPKRKWTPGVLIDLSNACRATTRSVAATGLFATVYDNINMMFRVAEQIVGRQSKLLSTCSCSVKLTTNICFNRCTREWHMRNHLPTLRHHSR